MLVPDFQEASGLSMQKSSWKKHVGRMRGEAKSQKEGVEDLAYGRREGGSQGGGVSGPRAILAVACPGQWTLGPNLCKSCKSGRDGIALVTPGALRP